MDSEQKPLHFLHLEDDPMDIELLQGYLQADNIVATVTVASSHESFEEALRGSLPDLVISDYYLPSFDGLTALRMLRARTPETPFILFSGAIGDLHAIELLKQGATDYVLKTQWERLPSAVRRALREAQERQERRKAEERFRLAIEASQGAVYDWDLVTGAVFRSDRFAHLLGIAAADVAPTREWWVERFHPEDRDSLVEAHERVVASETNYGFEYRVRREDGGYIHIWDKGIILRDPSGAPIRIVGSVVDITDRVEAERRQRASDALVEQILESSHDCIQVLDRDGRLRSMNSHGQQMFEIGDFEALHNMSWLDFWDDADQPPVAEALERARLGDASRFQGLCPTATGVPKWWDVIISPIYDADGNIHRLLAVAREITEQRRAEEVLRERQRQIEELNRRLQRAIAESHHRIKNNLQVLVSLVETMRFSSARTAPPGELERLARHIRGLAILHDLLTSETRRMGTELDTIPVRPILERLIPVLEITAGGQHIHCEIEDFRLTPKQCSALALLLNELVSNALKHGGGQVSVRLSADMTTTPPTVTLAVSDNGPGFPADFNPLKAANTGLELIESIGRWDLTGDILYHNPPTGGAEVVVTFPLESPAEPSDLPESVSTASH